MSGPLRERRSERNREPRRHYAEEQAYLQFQQQEEALRQRAVSEVAATIEVSDSDEEELKDDGGSSSEEEFESDADRENIARWGSGRTPGRRQGCGRLRPRGRVEAVLRRSSLRLHHHPSMQRGRGWMMGRRSTHRGWTTAMASATHVRGDSAGRAALAHEREKLWSRDEKDGGERRQQGRGRALYSAGAVSIHECHPTAAAC